MKLRICVQAAVPLALVAAPASAQEVTTRGVVASVDVVGGNIRLRKISGGYQDIQIAPDAELRVAGRSVTLNQVPLNSDADVLVWRDPAGGLHAARVVVPIAGAQTALPARPLPDAGSALEGEVVGFLPITGTLALRTSTGVRNVSLGTAPLMMNGREVTPFDLAIGDRIRIVLAPEEPGFAPRPALGLVLSSERVAGTRETFRAIAAGNETRPPAPPVAVNPAPQIPSPGPTVVPRSSRRGEVSPADEPGILIAPTAGTARIAARTHTRQAAMRTPHATRKKPAARDGKHSRSRKAVSQ